MCVGGPCCFHDSSTKFWREDCPSNSPPRRRGGGGEPGGEGMGKHRRISAVPSSLRRSWTFGRTGRRSSPSAGRVRGAGGPPILPAEVQACSAEFLEHGVRDARSTFSPIGRSPHIPGGWSRRPRRQFPLRPSGLQGVAVRTLWPRRPLLRAKDESGSKLKVLGSMPIMALLLTPTVVFAGVLA